MSCSFDKEKLTGYFDGELETAEKTDVERHISTCSECLRDLGEIKSSALLVKELPRHRAPRSLAEGVSREIAAARRVHSFDRWRKGLLWATAAAAGLFVAVNVVFFAGHAPQEVAQAPAGQKAEPVLATGPAHGDDRVQDKAAQARPQAVEEGFRRANKADEKGAGQDLLAKKLEDPKGRAAREKADDARQESKPQATGAPRPLQPQEPGAAKPPAVDAEKRSLDRERSAAPPADAKAPARFGAADAPATPPAAAPAPKPAAAVPNAPPAPERAQTKQKEMPAEERQRGFLKDAAAPAPGPWTVASADSAKARLRVEEALRKLGVKPQSAADGVPSGGKAGPRPADAPMTLELTQKQLADLRKELEQQPGTKVVAGRPQDSQMAALRSDAGGGGKVAGGLAAPGQGEGAQALKEQESKKALAEHRKAAEPAATEEAAKLEKAESLDRAGGEPRLKITLHFLEITEKK